MEKKICAKEGFVAKMERMPAKERAKKLSTDKEFRRQVFEKLLQHVRGGYSMQSFEMMSDTSVGRYLKSHPEEFCEEELADAMRVGQLGWESIGRRQAEGTCLGNSRSWILAMMNKYGWSDRSKVDADVKGAVEVSIVDYASVKRSRSTPGGDVK